MLDAMDVHFGFLLHSIEFDVVLGAGYHESTDFIEVYSLKLKLLDLYSVLGVEAIKYHEAKCSGCNDLVNDMVTLKGRHHFEALELKRSVLRIDLIYREIDGIHLINSGPLHRLWAFIRAHIYMALVAIELYRLYGVLQI